MREGGTPLVLFTWVTREASVDTSGSWDATPSRELVMNVEAYLHLLEAVGAKTAGLLVTLAALSQQDHETGMRYVEGSQQRIGQLASGGAFGWSATPTKEALDSLVQAGLLHKIESRALGRNRGSSPPKWILSPSLFAIAQTTQPAEERSPNVSDPSFGARNNGVFKDEASKPSQDPSRKGPQFLDALTSGVPHEMKMNAHIHHGTDDNDKTVNLLSVAVLRELNSLGWHNPESIVARDGAELIAAWILATRDRSNPGGYIRSQTKKPGWPFYPPGWEKSLCSIHVTPDGRLERVMESDSRTAPPSLTVADIVQILDEAGDTGRAIKREWLTVVDAAHPPLSAEARSRRLQAVGVGLLERHGLLPSPNRAEIA